MFIVLQKGVRDNDRFHDYYPYSPQSRDIVLNILGIFSTKEAAFAAAEKCDGNFDWIEVHEYDGTLDNPSGTLSDDIFQRHRLHQTREEEHRKCTELVREICKTFENAMDAVVDPDTLPWHPDTLQEYLSIATVVSRLKTCDTWNAENVRQYKEACARTDKQTHGNVRTILNLQLQALKPACDSVIFGPPEQLEIFGPSIDTFLPIMSEREKQSLYNLSADLRAYDRREFDEFWNSKKKSWHRSFTSNAKACRHFFSDELRKYVDDIIASTMPPKSETDNVSAEYGMLFDDPGPRDTDIRIEESSATSPDS